MNFLRVLVWIALPIVTISLARAGMAWVDAHAFPIAVLLVGAIM